MSAEEIKDIFDSIPPEDLELLGFSEGFNPGNFIIKNLLVIPPMVRPSNVADDNLILHDLTKIYIEIVENNNKYLKAQSADDKNELLKLLHNSVRKIFNNTEIGTNKYQNMEGIKQLLQGKLGMVRSVIMSKRQNYTARSVIGPDPYLPFGYVRIPLIMAPYLTQPEIVNALNIDRIKTLLKEKKITHITPNGGFRIAVLDNIRQDYLTGRRSFHYGDKIERHLQDGDMVILNRQPTLHKQSMMSFKVILGRSPNELTIKIHLSVTTPYNGDFDGDEINVHAPQGIQGIAELNELSNVTECIMSGQTNRPIMGAVLDTVYGATLLTQGKMDEFGNYVDIDIKKENFMKYQSIVLEYLEEEDVRTFDIRLKKHFVNKYSGRGLFSLLLPGDFNYTSHGKFNIGDKERNNNVIIRDGILISGIITASHIGSKSNSIIQYLWHKYGSDHVRKFFTILPWAINAWLMDTGFSIGISDCYPRQVIEIDKDKKVFRDEMNKQIEKIRMNIEALGEKYEDPIQERERENKIIKYINMMKGSVNKVLLSFTRDENAFLTLSASGAKGNSINMTQITALIGQVFYQEERIKPLMKGRTLPYFRIDEDSLESRGFIQTSYIEGPSPANMILALMAGREGIVNSATKASETGDLQRNMEESLRDIIIAQDGSVRTQDGRTVQAVYGYDGFMAEELINVEMSKGTKIPLPVDIFALADDINNKYLAYEIQ